MLLPAGCGDADSQAALPPTATPLAVTPLAEALSSPGAPLATIGYYYRDTEGARIVGELSFAGSTPRPLTPAANQIAVDEAAAAGLGAALRKEGPIQYAVCVARGRLEGPGAFGRYRFRLADPQLEPIAPLETTLGAMLDHPQTYRDRFVRITTSIIVLEGSALLVEQLTPGGAPADKSRQLKLRAPPNDPALLSRLRQTASGSVRFGSVQAEGFWQGRTFTPTALRVVG